MVHLCFHLPRVSLREWFLLSTCSFFFSFNQTVCSSSSNNRIYKVWTKFVCYGKILKPLSFSQCDGFVIPYFGLCCVCRRRRRGGVRWERRRRKKSGKDTCATHGSLLCVLYRAITYFHPLRVKIWCDMYMRQLLSCLNGCLLVLSHLLFGMSCLLFPLFFSS